MMKNIRCYTTALLVLLVVLSALQLKWLLDSASGLEKSTITQVDSAICEAFKESIGEDSPEYQSSKCQKLDKGQFEMLTVKAIGHLDELVDQKLESIEEIQIPYTLEVETFKENRLNTPEAQTNTYSNVPRGYHKANVQISLPSKGQFVLGQMSGDVLISVLLMTLILMLCFKIIRSFQIAEMNTAPLNVPETVSQIGSFTFDSNNLQLILDDKTRRITRKECQLLQFLAANKNRVVRREEILLALWGESDYFKGRSLDVFIAKLRQYLSDDETIAIETIYGVGFVLTEKEKS